MKKANLSVSEYNCQNMAEHLKAMSKLLKKMSNLQRRLFTNKIFNIKLCESITDNNIDCLLPKITYRKFKH